MKVSFVVNPIFINGGWSPWDTRIGGSEEFVVETSLRLAERGHDVQVFHNGRHGLYRGVVYRERAEYLERAGGGVSVNVNYPDLKPLEPTLYWSSLHPESGHDLAPFKEVFAISEWQIANSGIEHENLSILPPGYDSLPMGPAEKIPKTVLYSSSPTRGLDNLVRAWPEVVKRVPDAQLVVTYGATLDLPNCINLGEIPAEDMPELYATSDIWCHPCSGGELYCLAAVQAQVSGCWPVYFPTMALSETVKYGTKSDNEHLVEDLVNALNGHPKPETHSFPTWDEVTDTLEKSIAKWYDSSN